MIKMSARYTIALLALMSVFPSYAEEELDYAKILSYRDSGYSIQSESYMDAFGASHSKSNGQLYVSNTDLTIPQNGPDILVRRSHSPSQISISLSNRVDWFKPYYDFGDWSLDIPKITVMAYWHLGDSYLSSCNSLATTATIQVPGQGEFDAIGKPSGATYPSSAVMRFANNWVIGCETFSSRSVIKTKTGSVIGHSAKSTIYLKSPNGTTFYFNSTAMGEIRINPAMAPSGSDSSWALYQPQMRLFQVTDIVDKFGNWTTYDYKQIRNGTPSDNYRTYYVVDKIRSNEGVTVQFTRNDYKVASISYDGRVIEYEYDTFSANIGGSLRNTTYLKNVFINKTEESTKWSYDLSSQAVQFDNGTVSEMFLESITNPVGASMSFQYMANETLCEKNGSKLKGSVSQGYGPSLSRVTVSGRGFDTFSADFDYEYVNSTTAKTITTVGGRVYEDIFWVKNCNYMFNYDVRHLTSSVIKDDSGAIEQTKSVTWKYIDLPDTGITRIEDPNLSSDLPVQEKILINDRYETTFSGFDAYGNPTIMTEEDLEENRIRKVKTGYYNKGNKWIIGSQKSVHIGDGSSNYTLISNTSYHGGSYQDLGVPNYFYNNSTWTHRVSQYHSNGMRKKVELNKKLLKADGTYSTLNRYVLYEDYYRGVARKVTVPSRYNDTTKNILTKVVDNFGRPLTITNPLGTSVEFTFDNLGRLQSESVTGDEVAWLDTFYSYTLDSGYYGMVQLAETCRLNSYKTACTSGSRTSSVSKGYDSLLRNTSINEYSYTPSFDGRHKQFEYDEFNNKTFESYWGELYTTPNGTTTEYDALDRITSIEQFNKQAATFNYDNNVLTTTDPNGNVTTTTFWNFGSPQYELVESIEYGIVTQENNYDLFDNLLSVTLSGNDSGHNVSQTIFNVYDNNQRLCKKIRNDVGTTVFSYNAIGEISWQADLGVQAVSTSCSSSPSSFDKSYRVYDNHGGLFTLSFGDSITPTQTTKFDAIGNLTEAKSDDVTKTLAYYGNSLLKSETLTIGQQRFSKNAQSPSLRYFYAQSGALSSLQYPDGDVVRYSPNGFGQPTEVIRNTSSTRNEYIYAEDITYYPNGSLNSFYYGNGVEHETLLNSNKLPYRIRDDRAGQTHLDYQFSYDENFNVKSIIDHVSSAYSINNLSYDSLDRLTFAQGNSGIGNSTISYDPLGNIRSYSNKKNALTYTYNETNYRVSKVVDSKNSNNNYQTFGYDKRGNIYNNGKRTFTFNALNQIVSSNTFGYKYDGVGKRVYQDDQFGENFSLYSNGGKLLYSEDSDGPTNFIYLQDKLIAKDGFVREFKTKQHYTPYGKSIEGEVDDVGFTGHKYDKSTGLVYMQARYYDPVIGRFYSNDPVGYTSENPVMSFNRYMYVNNNPYKYTDPNGEFLDTIVDIGFIVYDLYDMATNGVNATNSASLSANIAGALIPGATGLGLAARVADKGVDASRGADNLVYRGGSGTPNNLTPRARDVEGLSANVNPLPGKNQVVDTSKLDQLCAVCDNPATGHVSIKPKDMSQMQGWINSRGGDTVHPLTQELQNAIVDQVKK